MRQENTPGGWHGRDMIPVHPLLANGSQKATSRRTVLASLLVACLTLAALFIGVAGKALPVARTQTASMNHSDEDRSVTSKGLAPDALAMRMDAARRKDRLRAQLCLTAAIYYEAASEREDGQRAVAQVILNRTRHPAWPKTVCGVVYQASGMPVCQFSYSCDGSMARRPDRAHWDQAARIAGQALDGFVYTPVGLSTFYDTLSVDPVWNRAMLVTAVIGNHIFYRLPGKAGTAAAFSQRYVGGEPVPGPLTPRFDLATTGQARPPASSVESIVQGPRIGGTQRSAAPSLSTLPSGEALPQYENSGRWIGR